MAPDFTQKLYVVEVCKPILVVRSKRMNAIKAYKSVQLLYKAPGIFVYFFIRYEFTHFGFSGRIADSRSSPAKQSNPHVPSIPQMPQSKKRHHVPDVQ